MKGTSAMKGTLKQFSAFLEQSKPFAEKYGKKTEYENLSAILEQGAKKELVLLVCGEFKRGKSSFVNALLGQELCPVADGIATSTVSIIRNGEKAKAVRHYSTLVKNKKNEEELSLNEEEISIDQISKFAKGTSDEIGNTMFIDIETPSALLQDGLVVIDTPGVGSLDPRHLFLTLQALPKADAFFYVTDTGEPLTTTELAFIKDRLVPTGKPFDLLLSKSDKVSRDELTRYIVDTENKVHEECGVKVKCTPVSSTEWDSFNKTGNERRRMNANCEAVYAAINSFRTRRELFFVEKFREQFVLYLDGIKKQASESLDAVKNNSNAEIDSLKQRLNDLSIFKNMVEDEHSVFRLKINSIIEESQEKVMQEFSKESILLSTQKLNDILNNPEAGKKGGEDYVVQKVKEAINQLGVSLDNKINDAIKCVMEELKTYIDSVTVVTHNFRGNIQGGISAVKHTFSESFVNNMRQALPFLGVSALVGTLIWWPIGIAAGIYYVVQSIIGSRKAERIAHIKNEITPRINIAINELRTHIQKRYTAFQKEVVNSLRSITKNTTQQMQETVHLMQECQQNNQIKAQKTKEIEGELKLVETLSTQVKVFGNNPFAKK